MQDLVIHVKPRDLRGRKNKILRRNKWVPAVVYGRGRENISFSLDMRDAEKYSKRQYENRIFTFQSESSRLNGLKVIKKEAAWHVVKRVPLHMDFLSLDMKAPIKVSVEVRFKGRPKGIQEGGVLNISLRQLDIECLPSHIPSFVEVDVSGLDLNDNLHVSDVKIPQNIKLITSPARTLCAVAEVKEEAVAEAAAGSDAPATAETPASASAGAEKAGKPEKKATKKS